MKNSPGQASKYASPKATRQAAAAPAESTYSDVSRMESATQISKSVPHKDAAKSENKQGLGGGGPVSHSGRSNVAPSRGHEPGSEVHSSELRDPGSASRQDTLFSNMPSSPSLSRVRRRLCLGTPRLSSTASPTPEPSIPSAFCRTASSMA